MELPVSVVGLFPGVIFEMFDDVGRPVIAVELAVLMVFLIGHYEKGGKWLKTVSLGVQV
jgi:hypothetical protein